MNALRPSRMRLAALAVAVIAIPFAVQAAPAAATTDADLAGLPAWDRVPTPNTGKGNNQLYAVDALTGDDVWSVGYSTEDLRDDPLIEHFDGAAWTITPTPDIGDSQFGAQLLAVDAVAPDDVWAVGGYGNRYSLIEHWDGTKWSLVPHPNPGLLQRLESVSAAGPDDVWAVGYIANNGVSRTHVLHWDGSAWSVVTSPNGSGGYNNLHGVDVVGPNDVWAVGDDSGHSLTLHWNGTSWSQVASPSGSLTAVSAIATDDIWAVGTTEGNTLTEHWDGTSWTVVPSPQLPGYGRLYGVSAIAAGDVWAVGESSTEGRAIHWDGNSWSLVDGPNGERPDGLRGVSAVSSDDVVMAGVAHSATLVLRWDGTKLRIVPSADRGTGRNDLRGVTAIEPDDVWAVGTVEGASLTQHWDGTAFSIVASPSKPGRDNVLEDVDATGSDDVWAVGHHDGSQGIGSRAVALQWDGTRWQAVRTPRGGAHASSQLLAVAAVALDDVWAVGTRDKGQGSRALTLHWDGATWQAIRNGCGTELTGITAFATNDVWAAGSVLSCHWNGIRWQPLPFGDPVNPQDLLDMADLDGSSGRDLWAVGAKFSQCGDGLCAGGEIQHFNGSAWTTVGVGAPTLDGVEVIDADDVWAVGFGEVTILHFNGTAWTGVPAPDLAGDGQADLTSVSASGPDDIWAVGPQLVGAPTGASLALHARAFSSGALVGDTHVAGATVSWLGPERGSVQTDSFGRYQIGGLTAGSYRLTVTLPGCVPASRTVAVVSGTTVSRDVTLTC